MTRFRALRARSTTSSKTASAGGQLLHPSEVKSSTTATPGPPCARSLARASGIGEVPDARHDAAHAANARTAHVEKPERTERMLWIRVGRGARYAGVTG